MRATALLIPFALWSCKGKDEPAPKPAPKPAIAVDAAPKPPGFELITVDEAVTRQIHTAALVLVTEDGAVSFAPRVSSAPGELELRSLTPSSVPDLSKLGGLVDDAEIARLLGEEKMQQQDAGADPCPVGTGYGFGRSGLGPGGGGTGDGWGTIGTGRYGTIGHGSGRSHAGLRGSAVTDAMYCGLDPLVIADARVPAARLVEVMQLLPQSTIGVTSDGGAHVRTLAITYAYLAGNSPPDDQLFELGFTVTPDAVRAAAYRGATADEATWSWTGDATGLADAYHASQGNPSLTGAQVRVRIDGAVTAGALITSIANLLAGNVEGVAIGEPIDKVTGSYGHAETSVLTFGQPTIKGEMDKNIVRRYLKRNAPKFRYCYEKALLPKPDLRGTLTLQFTILADGKVADAKVTGIDALVETCATTYLQELEFPKPPKGPVSVTYPFELRPQGG